MGTKRGFTLLELLIVVIIVGILASLAIPRYMKSTEASKGAEAYNNLNAIRAATWAHYATTGIFINGDTGGTNQTDYSDLKIEDPNTIPTRKFDYKTTTIISPFDIEARRTEGPYKDDRIFMHANGMIDDTSDWLDGGGANGIPWWRSI